MPTALESGLEGRTVRPKLVLVDQTVPTGETSPICLQLQRNPIYSVAAATPQAWSVSSWLRNPREPQSQNLCSPFAWLPVLLGLSAGLRTSVDDTGVETYCCHLGNLPWAILEGCSWDEQAQG